MEYTEDSVEMSHCNSNKMQLLHRRGFSAVTYSVEQKKLSRYLVKEAVRFVTTDQEQISSAEYIHSQPTVQSHGWMNESCIVLVSVTA